MQTGVSFTPPENAQTDTAGGALSIQKATVPNSIKPNTPVGGVKNPGGRLATGFPLPKPARNPRTPVAISKVSSAMEKDAVVAGLVRAGVEGAKKFFGGIVGKMLGRGASGAAGGGEQLAFDFAKPWMNRALSDAGGSEIGKRFLPRFLTGRSTLGSAVVNNAGSRIAMPPRAVPGYLKSVADAGGKATVLERNGALQNVANKALGVGALGTGVSLARGHSMGDALSTGAHMAGTGAAIGAGPAGWATLSGNDAMRRMAAKGLHGMEGLPPKPFDTSWMSRLS